MPKIEYVPPNNQSSHVMVIIREEVFIKGLPQSLSDFFVTENTFRNPKIDSLERLGKWTGNEPKNICLCRRIDDWIALPRGYWLEARKHIEDFGLGMDVRFAHPAFQPLTDILPTGELFDYQSTALEALIKQPNGVMEAPTGSGKSNIILTLISKIAAPTLIVVHTSELLDQTAKRCKAWLNYEPGIIGGGKSIVKDITIGMVQTLSRCNVSKDNPLYDRFGCVIVDECLAPDTQISTPDGTKPLGELRIGDKVCTPFGTESTITKIWKKRALAFRFQYATTSIVASQNHKILTRKHYSDELLPIGFTNSAFLCGTPYLPPLPYSEEEYLLGWIYADGTVTKSQIKFAFRKEDKISLFRNRFAHLTREFTNKRGDTVFTIEKVFGRYLRAKYALVPGKKAHIISFPQKLLATKSVGIVRGLMDANGSRTQNRISIDLASKVCRNQIHDILLFHGIHSICQKEIRRKNPLHNSRWRLCIYGDQINRYNGLIGWDIRSKHSPQFAEEWRRRNFSEQFSYLAPLGEQDLIDIEIDDPAHLLIANGLIVSNCHHSPALTWAELLRRLPCRYKYGFSATAWRKDKLDFVIWRMIGPITSKVYYQDVADAGRIVWPEIKFIPTNYFYDIQDSSEWSQMITDLTSDPERNLLIARTVTNYLGQYPSAKALILTDRIEHADTLAMMGKSMNPVVLTGALKKKARVEAMGKIRDGARLTIATIHLLGEGVDVPGWSLLFLASPFAGGPRVLQAVGRVARPAPGKDKALLLDFVDSRVSMLAGAAKARARLYKSRGE